MVVDTTTDYNVNWIDGATSYHWWIYTVNTDCSFGNGAKFHSNNSTDLYTNSRFVNIDWSNCNGTYSVNCKAINNCGETSVSHIIVNVSDCIPRFILAKSSPNTYVLKTNPSNPCNTLEADVNDQDYSKVQVYNTYGYQEQGVKIKGNELNHYGLEVHRFG